MSKSTDKKIVGAFFVGKIQVVSSWFDVYFVNEKCKFNPKKNDKKCYIQMNEFYEETIYDRYDY